MLDLEYLERGNPGRGTVNKVQKNGYEDTCRYTGNDYPFFHVIGDFFVLHVNGTKVLHGPANDNPHAPHESQREPCELD